MMVALDTAIGTRNPRLVVNRDVLDSLWIAALATGISYVAGFSFGWTHAVNPLEAFAVYTSYSCTYLCVKERRFNYPIGALSTAAYCLLFWQQGLYASMALNAYLTPALLYGWFRWKADANTRPVTRLQWRWIFVYLAVTAVAFVGALWINDELGGSFAITDSIILVGSILAQFLMDNKKVENWVVWFTVDVIAVWEYFASGLAIAGLQYVFFLANAGWGLAMWIRAMRRARSESPE
jgi:nicotinamide mononucleotide transporter